MKVGFIGVGKMGSRMVIKLLEEGHGVMVWNRSHQAIENLKSQISRLRQGYGRQANLKIAKTIEELVKSLDKPRIVWLMVTAGEATQSVLDEVSKFIERNDIVIDGGNSHFQDTQTRFEQFQKKGIRFLGIGLSGGLIGADKGYPMMGGGDKSAYEFVKPILNSLAKPSGGHAYFGLGGAGHFIKMVHNGIEYGIMQSLAEGFGVLDKSPYQLNLLEVAKLWQKGTLISGFILDRTVEVLSEPSILSSIEGYIKESGEAEWMIAEARREGVPIEIIEKSLEFRQRSQKDATIANSFAAKMIAALRQAFGGHEVKRK